LVGAQRQVQLRTTNRVLFNVWYDGLLALMNKPFELPDTAEELETLQTIEFELRIIQMENSNDSSAVLNLPEVPPPPSDYSFYYT